MKHAPRPAGGDTYDQAAYWFMRLRRGRLNTQEQGEFERWHAHGGNAAAYAAVQRSWSLTAEAGQAERSRRTSTLGALVDDAHAFSRRASYRPKIALAALTMLLVGGVGTATWLVSRQAPEADAVAPMPPAPAAPQTYITAVGERSTFTLDDGSQVSLNTASRLHVDFSGSDRRLRLVEGQALFDVAPMAQRPFIVHAGDHEVVALGTSFDVRLDAASLQVTLIEGRVNVADAGHRGERRETRLNPGQQFVSAGSNTPRVRPAHIEQITSWRDGKLIFSDEPLRQAVAEVNRYSKRKIILADESLGTLRISGVFHTGRPDNFVAAVTGYFAIHASEMPASGNLVLRKNG